MKTHVVKTVVTTGIGLSLLMLPVLTTAVPAHAKKGDSAQIILVAGELPLTQKMSDDACKSYFFQLGEAVGTKLEVSAETHDLFTQTIASYYANLSLKEKRSFASQVKSEKLLRKLWPFLSKDAKAQQRQQWANQTRETVTGVGTQILDGLQKRDPKSRLAVFNQLNPLALVTVKVVAFARPSDSNQGEAVKEYAGALLRLMGLPAPQPSTRSYEGETYSGSGTTRRTPRIAPNYSGQSDAMARAFRAGQGSGSFSSPNYNRSGTSGSYGTGHF